MLLAMNDANTRPAAEEEPAPEPDLVNARAIARRAVARGYVETMTPARVRQLAGPVEKAGDPDFPPSVPSETQERLWWWSQVEPYLRARRPSSVPRRYRAKPMERLEQQGGQDASPGTTSNEGTHGPAAAGRRGPRRPR
jgi:hypothetical protein